MKKIINSKGFALISVMLLAKILTMLTTSMLYISTYHLQLIGNVEVQSRAMKAAEAGVEFTIAKLNDSGAWGLYDSISGTWSGGTSVGPPEINVKFPETESEFYITFNKTQTKYMYSYNNLFTSDKIERITPAGKYIPPYCLDVIVYGRCKGTSKILRILLTRDDIFPYTLNADGKIMIRDADTYIRGENISESDKSISHGKSKSPGKAHSNWKDSDPNEPSIKKSFSSGNKLSTNRGFFSARGKIFDDSVDPNSYDCVKNENLESKAQIGELNIAQIINENKGKAEISIGPGEVNIIKKECEEENGNGEKEKHTEFNLEGLPEGSYTIDKKTGLVTILKDIYVSGTMNYDTQKDKWIGDTSVQGNSLYFKRSDDTIFTGESIYDELYGITEITSPYTAQYAKVDLNGHSIYSNSHLIMGVELIGQGSMVTTGKLSYLQGSTCDDIVAVSGDDLTIELSKNTPTYYANGLFYSNDDITVKPIANNSPLNASSTGTSIRNIYTVTTGKSIGSNIKVGKIIGYEKEEDKDGKTKDGDPIWGGNAVVMARVEENTGNSHIIIKPRTILTTGKIELTYNGKVIDFGSLKLAVRKKIGFPDSYEIGVVDSSGTIIWGISATSVTGFPSNLNNTEFADMGENFGETFYNNTGVGADLYIEGCLVSHNHNITGDYETRINSLELDSGDSTGIIDITYNKDTYINKINNIRGYNLGVRIISWQEIK